MRNILVIILSMLLSASIAASDPLRLPKDKTTSSGRLSPAKRAVDSCAAYGAGFAKIDGTDTCVKIGGAARIDFGGGSR